MGYRVGFLAAALGMAVGAAHAHGGHAGDHTDGVTKATDGEAKLFGRPGDPTKAIRIVRVNVGDAICRMPGELSLRQGDTVIFEISNSSKVEQELIIGTLREIAEHAESTEKDDDIPHDEPYMTHVHSGATESVVWYFTRVGIFYYGCHAPGNPGPGTIRRIVVFR